MTQFTFPMRPNGQKRPNPRDPATPEKIKKIDNNYIFVAFYIGSPRISDAEVVAAATATDMAATVSPPAAALALAYTR